MAEMEHSSARNASTASTLPMSRRRWLAAAAAASTVVALPARSQARGPTVRIVVPFAPGGGNDAFARQMADGLNRTFDRTIVVENRPGAGGNLGTEAVARAPADGTTWLLGHTGTVSINPVLYKDLKFNAATDLRPVAMFASSALLLVVPATSAIQDVGQLAETLRRSKGGLNYASSGSGTGGHLTGEMFTHMLGVKATHVPYKGTAPSLTDLAGAQVDFSFSVIPAALALVKAGKLRALAVTSAKRLSQLPGIPTVAESRVAGLAGFESSLTYGLLAPKGTSAAEIGKFGQQILQVAATPAFQSKLGIEGAEPMLGDAAAYALRIRQESAKWGDVVRSSGATA
jgi:tripartite-type tricarboxylate transporter receptor subunit TctC